jgi:hypothetical protein
VSAVALSSQPTSACSHAVIAAIFNSSMRSAVPKLTCPQVEHCCFVYPHTYWVQMGTHQPLLAADLLQDILRE